MTQFAKLIPNTSFLAALLILLLLSSCTPLSTDNSPSPISIASNQPWDWNGYSKFPSLYFAAEPDGPFTEIQLTKIRRFELAIVEFRAGQFMEETTTGLWAGGDLDGFMDEQARRIQENGGPPTLVYRNAMWAGSMYEFQRELLEQQHLFLQDARQCEGFIDYPLDVGEDGITTGLDYCRWDFRKAETREAFKDVVQKAISGSGRGVFFDNTHSVACDREGELSQMTYNERRSFLDAQNSMYAEVFDLITEQNKYPILSTTMGFQDYGAQVPWEDDCPRSQENLASNLEGIPFARNNEFWMWNLGELAARQILNTMEEARRGIPTIVHMPYFPEDGGCLEGCYSPDNERIYFNEEQFLEFGMAAFLVSMGPGSYFGYSNMQAEPEGGGWFDESWQYYEQYDTTVTGMPIGEASVSNNGMTFTRKFENGEVWINVANGTYALNLGENTSS
jgi:hypothetical protein